MSRVPRASASAGVCGVLAAVLALTAAEARDLSFDERVAAQTAIERVYWNHRIWPAGNPGQKPALSEAVPEAAIRAKVEDYLEKSNALEVYWQRPITGRQLQAEIDRMARSSKAPEMLRELFDALGHDAFLIAETLGRQKLADRLVRNAYARDEHFHGDVRARAKAALEGGVTPAELRAIGADYNEVRWVRVEEGAEEASPILPGADNETPRRVALDAEAWDRAIAKLAGRFGAGGATTEADLLSALPVGTVSPLREEDDRFAVTSVLQKIDGELTIAEASWPKRGFDAWWVAERAALATELPTPAWRYTLPQVTGAGCEPDTWAPTLSETPEPRSGHTAVWTGSEMIVWGGNDGYSSSDMNTGRRYDPVLDSWTPTSMGANVPSARSYHTAVWAGSEMIVWGGVSDSYANSLNTGGRYDPASDSWTPTSTAANVPSARYAHTAVWTGSEMIVWGGYGGSAQITGGRYDPASDSWTPTSTAANVPSARYDHTAVWTGSEMIVWGGYHNASYLNTGGRYDPLSDNWTPTSTGANVPSVRRLHTAVWTGSEMIVWGGYGGSTLNTGGRYDPVSDSWTPTSTGANVPSGRSGHAAVWTGSQMIVWGGSYLNSGGRYDPASDSWTPTSTEANVPSGRAGHTAVWTGSAMIVWGGFDDNPSANPYDVISLNTGGRYDPVSDSWTPTSTGAHGPSGRGGHTAVWTGSEMIVWGGYVDSYDVISLNTGGRYDPVSDSWTPTSTGANVPSVRRLHTAVWTGSEMIVWGGVNSDYLNLNTGGRYDPASDSWTPTSTGGGMNVPRYDHTAVWTGSEMIVWGGIFHDLLNTGSRYDPVSDSWTRTSTGVNVPSGRYGHTAVWTGSEMIVWGGYGGSAQITGGRYDPASDSWTPTSTGGGVPRYDHTAVWTGSEMIVWGGIFHDLLNTGSRYDPVSDSWTPTSTGLNVPSARYAHTAVWTGSEMIVWGGVSPNNTGGRYDPLLDSWTRTSTGANLPSARFGHSAVWTGSQMIVWGGDGGGSPFLRTGGRYCAPACLHPTTSYIDEDSDSFGDPARSTETCDGSTPAGYADTSTDCNDSVSSIHPGAAEACNGIDDNCNASIDEGHDQDLDDAADCVDNCPEIYNPDQDMTCDAATLFLDANFSADGFSSNRIDGRDLFVFAGSYGLCPGEPGYDASANLDRVPTVPGACIDAEDFHLFLNQFGVIP